jgi:hypothetical protein
MGVLSRATALPAKNRANNERQVSMAFFSPASYSCTDGHASLDNPARAIPAEAQPSHAAKPLQAVRRAPKLGCSYEAASALNFFERSTPVTKNWWTMCAPRVMERRGDKKPGAVLRDQARGRFPDVRRAGSEIDANSCARVRATRCSGGSQGEKVPDGGASGQKVRNPDAPG